MDRTSALVPAQCGDHSTTRPRVHEPLPNPPRLLRAYAAPQAASNVVTPYPRGRHTVLEIHRVSRVLDWALHA